MKKITCIFLLLFSFGKIFAQQTNPSFLREQADFYRQFHFFQPEQWDSLQEVLTGRSANISLPSNEKTLTCDLNGKHVFGWHPYWTASTAHNNYQWNLLSDFCYFDYEIDETNGTNVNPSFAWTTSAAVTAAKNNGVKIGFCASLFSNHSAFLANTTAQQTFINNVISLLQARAATGINIDFEGMVAADATPFSNFMQNLANQVHTAIPNSQISVALPSVDWSNVMQEATLANYVDLFIIMGYDYYYAGSTQAGPTSPLYVFQTSFNYSQSKSVTYYLKNGIPRTKLLLGVPYYGRKWQTTANSLPATTVSGSSSSMTFADVMANTNGYYSAVNKRWDNNSFSPYFAYQITGNWYQAFVDDAFSTGRKYDLVNQFGIGGIGIWALGYDNGYTAFWNKISEKFSTCAVIACKDSIFDGGGPGRNYIDAENFTYTIAPTNAQSLSLTFKSFNLESGFDSLFIYNGNSTSAPLIGGYSGTTSPNVIQAAGSALTLRFKADNATNKSGFSAVWTCSNFPAANENALSTENLFCFYPNPTKNVIYFDSQFLENKQISFYLIDLNGKRIELQKQENANILSLEGLNLAQGMYILQWFCEEKMGMCKILIEAS